MYAAIPALSTLPPSDGLTLRSSFWSLTQIFSASNYGGSMNKGAIMRFGRVQDRKR